MRRLLVSVSLVLVCLTAHSAAAQSLSFQGGGTTKTVAAARDFATMTFGDSWDFSQASDHAYMFSVDWQNGPAVAGGKLSGTSGANPSIQLQFEGVTGAMNIVGRNGVRFPIDPSLYNRISFKLAWSATPPSGNMVDIRWFQDTVRSQTTPGGRLSQTYAYDGAAARYVNQSPVASQSAPGAHVFKRDLDTTDPIVARSYWTTWNQYSVVRGLGIGLAGPSVAGTTIDVDWVRLTKRGSATVGLSWSGFGGAVTLTATSQQTGDVVQIFPDDGTAAATFADNSSFTWDYGFLPAGAWTIAAARGAMTQQITLTIKETPQIALTEPDETGGRDFATETAGDAWDLTASTDVSRWGGLYSVASPSYGASGLHGASYNLDPAVYLMDDSNKPAGTAQTVDGMTYRHLTFTVEYDRKDYRWDASTGFQVALGGVARVIWRQANQNGGPLTNTQDIVVTDGGPLTFSLDLPSLTKFGGDTCTDCALEVAQGQGLWQGEMALLRIDPFEPSQAQGFRIANVKLAADDEPGGNGSFLIKWGANDSSASVALYYDTDTNAANGKTLIVSGLPASAGQYNWNTASIGLGRYWIYAEITDSLGAVTGRYSTGPVAKTTVTALPPSAVLPTSFDGDAATDVAVFRPSNGVWYVLESNGTFSTARATQWGTAGDVPVQGDFDGDGKRDYAVWRPSSGTWYWLKSSTGNTTYATVQWGSQAHGDTPVPGDYDGDGQTDPAVYRTTTGVWYILRSATGYTQMWAAQWGNATDVPMAGDYDGDRATDLAVFRPSNGVWYVLPSGNGFSAPLPAAQWGTTGDVPVRGDFDGDGKRDYAVWRPSSGTWYWLRSSTGNTSYAAVQWGSQAHGDTPVPGDYDGDGKTDPAVFRTTTGVWYILRSAAGYAQTWAMQWGTATDQSLGGQR